MFNFNLLFNTKFITSKFFFYKKIFIFLALLHFHFEHHKLFINIMCFDQNLVEICGIFIITFIFTGFLIFYRNSLFIIYNKIYIKLKKISNYISFFNYFSLFFSSFKNFFFLSNFFLKKTKIFLIL